MNSIFHLKIPKLYVEFYFKNGRLAPALTLAVPSGGRTFTDFYSIIK